VRLLRSNSEGTHHFQIVLLRPQRERALGVDQSPQDGYEDPDHHQTSVRNGKNSHGGYWLASNPAISVPKRTLGSLRINSCRYLVQVTHWKRKKFRPREDPIRSACNIYRPRALPGRPLSPAARASLRRDGES
jgi:hypothetical protein